MLKRQKRPILVRCFLGAPNNQCSNFQNVEFDAAWIESEFFQAGATLEKLSHVDVKDNKWQYSDIISWLKQSDVHIIMCHMHQGVKHFLWDCLGLYIDILDLENHLGFPMAENLVCPIFTQNKLNYLSALQAYDKTNFTLSIELESIKKYSKRQRKLVFPTESKIFKWNDVSEIIDELRNTCKEADTCEWVLKFPFKTNGFGMHYCKDIKDLTKQILNCLHQDNDQGGLLVPYGMIQPRLKNGREYKIILLNGQAVYHFTKDSGSNSTSFVGKQEMSKLYRFAEGCLQILKEKRPGTIADGLVRVDVMQRNDKAFIVNEFEGFEAFFKGTDKNELLVKECIRKFWAQKLAELFKFI